MCRASNGENPDAGPALARPLITLTKGQVIYKLVLPFHVLKFRRIESGNKKKKK